MGGTAVKVARYVLRRRRAYRRGWPAMEAGTSDACCAAVCLRELHTMPETTHKQIEIRRRYPCFMTLARS